MNVWQITSKNEILKNNATEDLVTVDDLKIKITKCLVTSQDVATFSGFSKNDKPIIPSSVGVGLISETLEQSNYFTKGAKVYIASEKACKSCVECLSGNEDKCCNVQRAAVDYNGYLKEFAVVSKEEVHILPKNVTEYQALFIDDISIALSVIDELQVSKGEHVAILGGNIFANILGQLIAYYQGVPIIVDDNLKNLERANRSGIYYTTTIKDAEKEIINITGGRKCGKIIYVTESGFNFDTVGKLAKKGAIVGVSGSVKTKSKLTLDVGISNNLTVKFITSGYGNSSSSINILNQKAIDFTNINIPEYKFDYINKQFENFSKHSSDEPQEFIVNLV